jgi:glucose-1-phosphate thymidylyltransferase
MGVKGIVLAGGTGRRLWPITLAVSKQLLPIYNKPLIYYPISVLMQSGIREILIITTPGDQKAFQSLLGDGSSFGLTLTYEIQENPKGIAQAFIIGQNFIGNDQVSLILGDNLFYGVGIEQELPLKLVEKGARIFTYNVSNPTDYGVLNLDSNLKPISVDEKPKNPKSNLAITGLYFFDTKVVEYAYKIKPSERGELEITEIMQQYINNQDLEFVKLPTGVAWLDTGSPNSLSDASQFVRVLEERTGKNIACLEEIAYLKGWINSSTLSDRVDFYGDSSYGKYLNNLLKSQ